MNFRPFVMAGVFAAALAAPMAAEAAAAHAVTDANLRTGPSTSYRALTVIPGGALVQIFDCSDWCRVGYRGYSGWVSASLVDQGARCSIVVRQVRNSGSTRARGGTTTSTANAGMTGRTVFPSASASAADA
jgi:uncharacterized protein YraI